MRLKKVQKEKLNEIRHLLHEYHDTMEEIAVEHPEKEEAQMMANFWDDLLDAIDDLIPETIKEREKPW